MSNIEYDPSGNSNLSFHVGTDILNSLLMYEPFIFFHVYNKYYDLIKHCLFCLFIYL